MPGGASKGAARPGSAGYIYRHGWIPVAGSGAIDKRSKAKQRATPSAPATRPRRPEFERLTDKQVESRRIMFGQMAAANDLSPDMRDSVNKALRDIETERQHRGLTDIAPSAPTPAARQGAQRVEKKLRKSPDEVAKPPEHRDPGNPKFEPTHRDVFHATPRANLDSIRQTGFRQTAGSGENGAFFGTGTYFHVNKDEADDELEGYRSFIDPSMEQLTADVQMNRPFTVNATSRDTNPGQVMHRALVGAGLASSGERLTPDAITARLKQAGYDGVEVKQDGFNSDIGGSQLIVFDASTQTKVKPPSKSDKLSDLPQMDVQTSHNADVSPQQARQAVVDYA